jgi:hypothetical protein
MQSDLSQNIFENKSVPFDNATQIYQLGFCKMPNRKVKKIAIYIAIFCTGTITGTV